jgi:hypothetical protein
MPILERHAAMPTLVVRPWFSARLCRHFLQPIAVLDMEALQALKLLQKLACLGAIVPVAFELGDKLSLPGHVSLSVENVTASHFQVFQHHASVHAPW